MQKDLICKYKDKTMNVCNMATENGIFRYENCQNDPCVKSFTFMLERSSLIIYLCEIEYPCGAARLSQTISSEGLVVVL